MTEQQIIYTNLYTTLLKMYDDDSNTLVEEKRKAIPTILAFLAVHMQDVDKVREVADKFGAESYTTPITQWGYSILRMIEINLYEERPSSPTNIQDIETEIIH